MESAAITRVAGLAEIADVAADAEAAAVNPDYATFLFL